MFMKNIKRLALLILAVIPLLGVSGCMKQPTENENKANEKAMLAYLNKKYGVEFTNVEYIPAKRGFNDSLNENILVTKSDSNGGIIVNVREEVARKGECYDDYINSLASKYFGEKIDYSKIEKRQFAKTYISLRPDKVNIEDLQSGNIQYTKEQVIDLSAIISVPEKSNEKTLKELYDVYNQIQSFGYENNFFIVGFSGDPKKAENYVNNNNLYGTKDWEEFDKSIKEVLYIKQNGLSFEQFKEQLKAVSS
jgi:uncharacterized protein (UPF0297 family)